MRLVIDFGKRHLAMIVLVVGLFVWLGFALAGVDLNEPYHPSAQVSLPNGDSLAEAFSGTGSVRLCTSANSGDGDCSDDSGSSTIWQGSSDIYYTGGRVGIGTSNPSAGLEISRSSSHLKLTSSSGEGVVQVSNGKLALGNWSYGGDLFVNLDTGNIGVGTGSPDEKLVVNGRVKLEGDVVTIGSACTSADWGVITKCGTGTLCTCASIPGGDWTWKFITYGSA